MEASKTETQLEIDVNLAYLEREVDELKKVEYLGERALIYMRCDIYLDDLLNLGWPHETVKAA